MSTNELNVDAYLASLQKDPPLFSGLEAAAFSSWIEAHEGVDGIVKKLSYFRQETARLEQERLQLVGRVQAYALMLISAEKDRLASQDRP